MEMYVSCTQTLFEANLQTPEILWNRMIIAPNLGTFGLIRPKVAFCFFSCSHGGRGTYFGDFFSCPHGGRGRYFGVFFDFGSYKARMKRRGHGCSAEGTRDGRTTSQRV